MGEYILDAPNSEETLSKDVIAYFAQVTGYAAERIGRAMFILDVAPDPEAEGDATYGGFAIGGNLSDHDMLHLAAEATEYLYTAMVNQRIADSVPDDVSGLEAA